MAKLLERNYKVVKRDRQGLEPTRKPTAIEIAWAAGIYEGEGSCLIGGGTGESKSFAAQVSQKGPELLYRLREMFGGSVKEVANNRSSRIVPNPPVDRVINHWRVCGDKARLFFACIYPFLTARRKQQIDASTVSMFLEDIQDLLVLPAEEKICDRYQKISTAIDLWTAERRAQAAEHKAEYFKKYYQQPEVKERERLKTQTRRANMTPEEKEVYLAARRENRRTKKENSNNGMQLVQSKSDNVA